MKISAISLISYDAEYLPRSISKYYNYVDEIVLGLDVNRTTWAGNKFSFDESKLWSELQQIDGDNKISIIEENFCVSDIAIQNDNYERNFLKNQCSNDWIVSVDADEELLNAKEFFYQYCPLVAPYKASRDILMTWALPYKIIGDKVLVIANEDNTPFLGETQGFMTSKNNTFTYARWTDQSASGQNRLQSPAVMLHWSCCRKPEALKQKLWNTGHANLAPHDPFMSIWEQVTLDNYTQYRNLKTAPLGSLQWPKLVAVPLADLETFIKNSIKQVY